MVFLNEKYRHYIEIDKKKNQIVSNAVVVISTVNVLMKLDESGENKFTIDGKRLFYPLI